MEKHYSISFVNDEDEQRLKDAIIRARELLESMDEYMAELDAAELLRILNMLAK